MTTGLQAKYSTADRPKSFYRNNIYHLVGGDVYPTNLGSGATLATGEKIINTKIFTDSSAAFPQQWTLTLNDTSSAIHNGVYINLPAQYRYDFNGNPINNPPSIGAYEFIQSTPPNKFKTRFKFVQNP